MANAWDKKITPMQEIDMNKSDHPTAPPELTSWDVEDEPCPFCKMARCNHRPAPEAKACERCGRGICVGCNHWRDDEETLETN